MKKTALYTLYRDGLLALAPILTCSILLLTVRVIVTGELRYVFLLWNLFLAVIPAVIVLRVIKGQPSKRFTVIAQLVAWLLFFPNTFYLLTDFIHLDSPDGVTKLFDAVLLFSFTISGFMLGIGSLMALHIWLAPKISAKNAWYFVSSVIGASSFAVYLGRYLRWNSWDIAMNPLGLLFDVSDRFINPSAHPRTFTTTFLFFVIISAVYMTLYSFGMVLRKRLKPLR